MGTIPSVMQTIPDLVDNGSVSGQQLAAVLASVLSDCSETVLWVATAYFNLDGFDLPSRWRLPKNTGAHCSWARPSKEPSSSYACLLPTPSARLLEWRVGIISPDDALLRAYRA
jgi:hypothetical protein